MDAMGSALKKKIGGMHITIAPVDMEAEMREEKNMNPQELAAHEKGESPLKEKAEQKEKDENDSDDLAPSLDKEHETLSQMHDAIGSHDHKGSMGLGDRAKSKMQERMASIKKEKMHKGY